MLDTTGCNRKQIRVRYTPVCRRPGNRFNLAGKLLAQQPQLLVSYFTQFVSSL